MVGAGDPVPDVTVWLAPREPVSMRALSDDGPILLLFDLFDWSAT